MTHSTKSVHRSHTHTQTNTTWLHGRDIRLVNARNGVEECYIQNGYPVSKKDVEEVLHHDGGHSEMLQLQNQPWTKELDFLQILMYTELEEWFYSCYPQVDHH